MWKQTRQETQQMHSKECNLVSQNCEKAKQKKRKKKNTLKTKQNNTHPTMPRYIFSKRNGHRDGDSVRLATFTISTNKNQHQTLTTHTQTRPKLHTQVPSFCFMNMFSNSLK